MNENHFPSTGFDIKSIGCSNTSIVFAAENDVIAWGASPTYGELVSSILNCVGKMKMKEN